MKAMRHQEDLFGLEEVSHTITVAREKYGGPEAI